VHDTQHTVLGGIGLSYPLIEAKDTYWQDFGVMVAIAVFYKILYVVGVYVKSSRMAKVHPNKCNTSSNSDRAAPEAVETAPPKIKEPAFSTNAAYTMKQHILQDDERGYCILIPSKKSFFGKKIDERSCSSALNYSEISSGLVLNELVYFHSIYNII